MTRFTSTWEPMLIEEVTIASGTWFYSDSIPYRASLIRQRYNYTSHDLVELDSILEIPYVDYIDYNISDEGVIYFWLFKEQNSGTQSTSPTFSTYFSARDHLSSYGKNHDIAW